jgi:uncharacterized protein YlxP (DUF503 family)
MVIGLLRVRLHLPFTHSLKEKRSILKPLINRLRTNYNCAVAETDLQDMWQSAELALVTVYAEKAQAEKLLTSVEKEFLGHDDMELVAQEIEFL